MKPNLPALVQHQLSPLQDGLSTVCYENEIPPQVEGELERLYQNVFSSLAHFRIYGEISDAGVFLIYRREALVDALLFRIERRRLVIQNEGIRLSRETLVHLCHFAFRRFAGVTTISFHAIAPTLENFPFPFQRTNCGEDIVLSLPPSVAEYESRLGRATRKSLRQHVSRVRRAFPSFEFEVFQRTEVRERDVRAIIELNRQRMAGKRRESAFDETETWRLVRLAKARGVVSVIRIDGKLCAGSICLRIGDDYFSRVNAHDPAYDSFRLGSVCCYLGVRAAIEQGGREYHFLWGRYAYKYQLLGQQRDLDSLTVFRSGLQLVRHAAPVCRTAGKGLLRQLRLRTTALVRRALANGFGRPPCKPDSAAENQ